LITHNLIQGSAEWHAYRATHDNASDAPAVMGCSSYKTREQLLAERATGIVPEVDAATQRRFDAGHRFEALARPLAEAIIGEDLYPCTGSMDCSRLSASFDGLTLLEDVAWEHKTLNKRLCAVLEVPGCTGDDLPMEYQIQLEQQCAVSGCERILFMASVWDSDDQLIDVLHCWYMPNEELRARILAGWEQFHKDVAAYVPPEPKPVPVVAEPMESLPAVSVRLDGKLAVVSNLPDFAAALRSFIERIPSKPDTDQEFATADAACKALKRAEDALTAGEDAALGEMVDFEAMRRQVRDLKELARATRLATEKLVTARKEQIRGEIVAGGVAALRDHIASLNTRLGKPYMPQVPADFGGVVKGKRTVDSLRGAVNDELARCKIAANEVADRIQVNLNTLRELASAHAFLFADTATIVLKQPDDLTILVKSRIAEHEAAEAQRLEAERERIRFEELAKLQRETAAQTQAELARQRAAEENERNQAAALTKQAQAAIKVDDVVDAEVPHGAVLPVAATPTAYIISLLRDDPEPAERTGTPTLKLGQIAERLGFTLTADFLKGLGFEPAATDRASKLYHEADFTLILAALVRHIEAVQSKAAA
jgi:putative phage-type endonuclease